MKFGFSQIEVFKSSEEFHYDFSRYFCSMEEFLYVFDEMKEEGEEYFWPCWDPRDVDEAFYSILQVEVDEAFEVLDEALMALLSWLDYDKIKNSERIQRTLFLIWKLRSEKYSSRLSRKIAMIAELLSAIQDEAGETIPGYPLLIRNVEIRG